MSKVKIGFIGCGGIAFAKHFPGIAQEDDVELAAFCDIIKDRAVRAAKEWGTEGAKTYTDYRELLQDSSLDAVHVLTPNVAHSEITIAALKAGKHVLCEKPMSVTAEDAERILQARDKSGKLLTIGYQYRHFHENQIMKKAIDDGFVGDIYYAEASFMRTRGVPNGGSFTSKEKNGGGPLIDLATHALDLTLWMMDNYEPEYVTGIAFEKLGRLLPPHLQGQVRRNGTPDPWDNENYGVEDSAMGFVKMKNGAVIYLKSSWILNAPASDKAEVLLCGTKGGIDNFDSEVTLNHVLAGQQAITKIGRKIPPFIPGYRGSAPKRSREAEIWVNALKGCGELFVTADQAYVVTRILDGIYKSSRTGAPVYF